MRGQKELPRLAASDIKAEVRVSFIHCFSAPETARTLAYTHHSPSPSLEAPPGEDAAARLYHLHPAEPVPGPQPGHGAAASQGLRPLPPGQQRQRARPRRGGEQAAVRGGDPGRAADPARVSRGVRVHLQLPDRHQQEGRGEPREPAELPEGHQRGARHSGQETSGGWCPHTR